MKLQIWTYIDTLQTCIGSNIRFDGGLYWVRSRYIQYAIRMAGMHGIMIDPALYDDARNEYGCWITLMTDL